MLLLAVINVFCFIPGLAQISVVPGVDHRVTEIRHLNMSYSFQTVPTKATWLRRAEYLRQQILVSAGLWPFPEKTPLNSRIFGKIEKEGYTIEKVYFESYPGFFVTGNLYRPLNKEGPFPGILSPHGHWTYGRLENQQVASVPGRCINFARQGYVVFSYDMVGYNDSQQIRDHSRPLAKSLSLWGIGSLGLQLWNSIRSVDFLQSLSYVDKGRLGCTGASGGGTQTFLLTAVDNRIGVSAPVNMISHYMQGGDVCENQANLRLDTNNMEIAALMAPRPLLMVSAAGDWTRDTPRIEFPAIQGIYRLFGATNKVQSFQSFAVHNFNQQSREAVYSWFGRWLLGESDRAKFSEKSFRLPTPSEMLVFFGRELPKSAVTEDQLMEYLIGSYQVQLERLKPKDLQTLSRYREIMVPTFRQALAAHYPDSKEVIATNERSTGSVQKMEFFIGRKNRGDRVPVVLWFPKGRRSCLTATLLIHSQGKEIFYSKAKLLVETLLSKGHLVMSVDTFNTGEVQASRDMNDRFFTTYNRTDDANRVQDVLTALSYLQRRREIVRINLAGFGKAGLWCLLARALAPELHRTAADVSGFQSNKDQAYLTHLYIPVLRRAGDFKTALTVAPTSALLVYNTGSAFETGWVENAYRITEKTSFLNIESRKINQIEVIEWLCQNDS